MKHKSDFKHSRSKTEVRLANVAREFIAILTDEYICLICGHHAPLQRGEMNQLYLPARCGNCKTLYGEKFDYCCPDIIIFGEDRRRLGVIYCNEEDVHGRDKVIERDHHQIEKLRDLDYDVFVIMDFEINRMTNASLKLWLLGVRTAMGIKLLPKVVYNGDKDYPCLL